MKHLTSEAYSLLLFAASMFQVSLPYSNRIQRHVFNEFLLTVKSIVFAKHLRKYAHNSASRCTFVHRGAGSLAVRKEMVNSWLFGLGDAVMPSKFNHLNPSFRLSGRLPTSTTENPAHIVMGEGECLTP